MNAGGGVVPYGPRLRSSRVSAPPHLTFRFPMNLALFASGGGSNAQAILDAIGAGRLPATAQLLVADRPGIGALEKAERAGVPGVVVPPGDYDTPDAFGAALLDALHRHGVDFVALAGYLRHVPPAVVGAFRHRMLNVHPSLLPAFGGAGYYGMRVHRAALEAGVRWSGCTVHLVDEHYDTGPIVLQEPVPVEPGDTPELLQRRVLAAEHRLFPEALRLFATGQVRVDGRRVRILPAA